MFFPRACYVNEYFFLCKKKHFVTQKELVSCKIKLVRFSRSNLGKESKVFCSRKELNRTRHVSGSYPMRVRTCIRVYEHVAHTYSRTRSYANSITDKTVYRHGMARLSERAGCYTSGNQDLFACGRPN